MDESFSFRDISSLLSSHYDEQLDRVNKIKTELKHFRQHMESVTPVPRHIFQTWKEKVVTNPILKGWQQSWTDMNPGYSYTLFDDADNRAFVENNFPDMLETYDGYEKTICRADAIRYMYLYVKGGIYADLDFQCLQSFEPLLKEMEKNKTHVVLGGLGKMDKECHEWHDIPNALIISKPKADFWLFVMNALKNTKNTSLCPEILTGPVFIKLCVEAYMGNPEIPRAATDAYGYNIFENIKCEHTSKIFILQPEFLYPINWGNSEHDQYRSRLYEGDELRMLFPRALAVTFWMHSW